jgi:transposase
MDGTVGAHGFAVGGADGRVPLVVSFSKPRAEKPDVTLQALRDRLLAERGVKADTSMMSRFFRRLGVTFKKRPLSRASKIVRT